MKIKEIEITNFKSIGATVRIPIRPITLMFGENSVGKSSVLQCLLLLAQSLESGFILRTRGEKVDLGAFKNFIHLHDTSKPLVIKIRFELDTDWEWIINYKENGEEDYGAELSDVAVKFQQSLRNYSDAAVSLSFVLRGKTTQLDNLKIFLGDEDIPILTYYSDKHSTIKIEHAHSYWKGYANIFNKDILDYLLHHAVNITNGLISSSRVNESYLNNIKEQLNKCTSRGGHIDDLVDLKTVEFSEYCPSNDTEVRENGLNKLRKIKEYDEELEKFLELFLFETEEQSYYPSSFLPVDFNFKPVKRWLDKRFSNSQFDEIDFHPLFIAIPICYEVRSYLNSLLHIEALRQKPKRYYFPEDDVLDINSISRVFPKTIAKVNAELKKLNQPYKIKIIRLEDRDIDNGSIFKIGFQDLKKKVNVTIQDVGFGFSQVLPIIFKSTVYEYSSFLIEQPELHLHPGMQTQLGDFFIRRIKNGENKFIIETHSEHLVLRLLRRIRQTTNGKLPRDVPPLTTDDVSIVYFRHGSEGTVVTHLPVTVDGDFEQEWPEGFFDERERELFD